MNRSSWIVGALVGAVALGLGVYLFSPGEDGPEPAAGEEAPAVKRPTAKPGVKGGPANEAERAQVGAKSEEPRFGRAEAVAIRGVTPDVISARSEALRLARERRVELGPFDADAAGLEAVVKARRSDLNSCFRTARYHDPDLPEDVELTIVLESDDDRVSAGPVNVSFSGDADPTILEGCLSTVFEELIFEGQPGTLVQRVRLSAD